ncbi:hypothetical protein V4Y02_23665, partial [Escherichia coli]
IHTIHCLQSTPQLGMEDHPKTWWFKKLLIVSSKGMKHLLRKHRPPEFFIYHSSIFILVKLKFR